MTQDIITFALPKGRLLPLVAGILRDAGILRLDLEENGRRLVYNDPERGLRYLICRTADVPTFVEYGAADLGIAGKDVILEQGKDICELANLGFGQCKFVVAVPSSKLELYKEGLSGYLSNFGQLRVATKFPRVAEFYLRSKGLPERSLNYPEISNWHL